MITKDKASFSPITDFKTREGMIIKRDTKSHNDQVDGSAILFRLVLVNLATRRRGAAANLTAQSSEPGGFENETASERRTRDRGETWQSDVAQGCPTGDRQRRKSTATYRGTRMANTGAAPCSRGSPDVTAVHAILFRPLKDERELLHPSCLRLFPPPKAVFLSEEKESKDGNDDGGDTTPLMVPLDDGIGGRGPNVYQLIHVMSKGCGEWETKSKTKIEEKEQDKKVRLTVRASARCVLADGGGGGGDGGGGAHRDEATRKRVVAVW
ncbi:hypothetical protein G5I_03192 [Acromyrmex echinatior]|uniref:Uncharacterized protein n=1 Tax=Acromyrmex echinatior TaxID=103372 RepID=F4WCB8_ACREC|nr:hypothetical protein G5I_03192 [Acromyrmex echinatior]